MNPTPSSLPAPSPGLREFILEPSSPRPLGAFRIGVTLVLLLQAWSLSDHLMVLFGDRGLIPWSVSVHLSSPYMPRLSGLVPALGGLGLGARNIVHGLALVYVLALGGLLLGWRTRACAVVAFLTHTTLFNSGTLFSYGVEIFAHISLFYCVLMPVGEAYSLDVRAGRVSGAPSAEATLSLRVLQVHLCMVYLTTGGEKALGTSWREGTAIWEALMQPQYGQFDFAWMAHHPWVSQLVSWGTLVVEVGYAVFVWPRQTRALWVLLTVGLHLGIALLMGLWLFSAIMAVLTFAAFGWEELTRALAYPVLPARPVSG